MKMTARIDCGTLLIANSPTYHMNKTSMLAILNVLHKNDLATLTENINCDVSDGKLNEIRVRIIDSKNFI